MNTKNIFKKNFHRIIGLKLGYPFFSFSNKTGLKELTFVEAVKGPTSKKLLKQCDEYAKEVLGWKGYAPWLYVYSAFNNKFIEGWIPDNYYARVVIPKLKGHYGPITDYNALTAKMFSTSHFPDILYYTNGFWLSPLYEIIPEKDVFKNAFTNNNKVVYKIDDSLQGRGVYVIEKKYLDPLKLKQLGNGVLQKYINQHAFFNEIMPNSVATIRLTSVLNNEGQFSINACYLRVARQTHTHVISKLQVRIPVDITNGALNNFGYTMKMKPLVKHPDTGYIFENKHIPYFDKIKETALKLHKMVPFTRTIGWDMILDQNNEVVVMEWNGSHNGITFDEATQGPCYANLGWEHLWKQEG